ncbi:hypothetical protein FB567DRAFT_539521 [Paraphoma chrysanthemicola]|uniref:Methyltransferase domain-containing protein n=1 Tax=Paraphoma chrysanthemicola TaxID=798071 RepID=A0A8K0QV71_9PLEO|nr:hypothetical protein FB567DRAFT_539521 [Paraphoma chrysanthemicola]
MSQQDNKTHTFDFGEIDWDVYESHRPPYPRALYEMIFQHHGENGGRWDTALDVGAGGGIVTKVLLEHFQHVACSDAAAGYVSQAGRRFAQESNARRASFLERKFDEFNPDTDFPNGSLVDMVTAGTCIHFGDPSKLTTQLAPLTRSGGTLAAFSYGSVPILPIDEPARQHIAGTKDKIIRWFHENVKNLDQIDATGTPQARYNNVDFEPTLWTDVRRITSLPGEHVFPEWIKTSESRVRAEVERVEVVQDDFITRTVDYGYFPEYFRNLAPGYDISGLIADDLKKIKEVLGDRMVLAKWPLIMVLASRR